MWCPSKKECTAVSECPESECVGVDAHGCNSCDGERWCESAGKCQYGSIPCFPKPGPTPKPEVAICYDCHEPMCFATGGATQMWCPSKKKCTAVSKCPDSTCTGVTKRGCNACDGEVWCESAGKGQYGSIPCEGIGPKPVVQPPQMICPIGGALQMWCPSKKKCTAVSKCPESECVGVDAHGCNSCDGEKWCEAAGKCQYGSIPCFPKPGTTPKPLPILDPMCFATGGATQMWCPSKKECTAVSECPDSTCTGVTKRGCNACDGEVWCEAAGKCQYGSIPCWDLLEPEIAIDCFSAGG